jgi:hypothetical protein
MLKFDETHESLDGKVSVRTPGRLFKSVVFGVTVIIMLALFSGCAATVECGLEGRHAHVYKDSSGYTVLIESEKAYKFFDGELIDRTEDHVFLSEEQAQILDYANKHGLISLKVNKDHILDNTKDLGGVKEYEYTYDDLRYMQNMYEIGDQTYYQSTPYYVTERAWTTDANHKDLTGKERVSKCLYYGYKIQQDADGKIEVVKSEGYESLDDLIDDGYVFGDKKCHVIEYDYGEISLEKSNELSNSR